MSDDLSGDMLAPSWPNLVEMEGLGFDKPLCDYDWTIEQGTLPTPVRQV